MKPYPIAMIVLAALVLLASVSAKAQTAGPTTQPTTAPITIPPVLPTTRMMSSDQMMTQLLGSPPGTPGAVQPTAIRASNAPAAVDKTTGAGAVKPAAPVINVMREGTVIVDRIARLTRSPDGTQSQLTFESDGKAMRDPPMVLLPNSLLAAMEGAVTGSNRDLRFRVTGTVTEYRARNYMLLQKVVVVPDIILQQY